MYLPCHSKYIDANTNTEIDAIDADIINFDIDANSDTDIDAANIDMLTLLLMLTLILTDVDANTMTMLTSMTLMMT